MGITLLPDDTVTGLSSPDGSVIIAINIALSEEGQAQGTAHEAYGHAFLESKGEKSHHEPEFRFADSLDGDSGFVETNEALSEAIRRAIRETIENMENE